MELISIYISPSGGASAPQLPSIVKDNIDSLKKQHPHLPHKLYANHDILGFLETQFPREVIEAYHALRPCAYKADLARYCLLYENGGIYADLSYYFVGALPMQSGRALVFRDFLSSSPWDTSNGVMAVPPRHPALLRAIELVCANVARGYYGLTPLCPTGPVLFGKALAQTCEAEDLVTGHAIAVGREALKDVVHDLQLPAGPRIHCLSADRRILAIKRKPMSTGRLSDLGITDGDTGYSDYWRARTVYQGRPN